MNFQRIALFISGKGSNARNIMKYFHDHEDIAVSLVLSSAENPEMEAHCEELEIAFERLTALDMDAYLRTCRTHQVDWIILAGFLKKIPAALVEAYPNRIINIHPALLPSFGGQGMYGSHVHKAVAAANVHFSGITIHLVNEEFDKGKVLAQFAVSLSHPLEAQGVEQQVRGLEMKHFPKVLEEVICSKLTE